MSVHVPVDGLEKTAVSLSVHLDVLMALALDRTTVRVLLGLLERLVTLRTVLILRLPKRVRHLRVLTMDSVTQLPRTGTMCVREGGQEMTAVLLFVLEDVGLEERAFDRMSVDAVLDGEVRTVTIVDHFDATMGVWSGCCFAMGCSLTFVRLDTLELDLAV